VRSILLRPTERLSVVGKISCYGDHLMDVSFHDPGVPSAIDWGDQPYGKDDIYGMALRVHEELRKAESPKGEIVLLEDFQKIV